jgi:hypothetical protein
VFCYLLLLLLLLLLQVCLVWRCCTCSAAKTSSVLSQVGRQAHTAAMHVNFYQHSSTDDTAAAQAPAPTPVQLKQPALLLFKRM